MITRNSDDVLKLVKRLKDSHCTVDSLLGDVRGTYLSLVHQGVDIVGDISTHASFPISWHLSLAACPLFVFVFPHPVL